MFEMSAQAAASMCGDDVTSEQNNTGLKNINSIDVRY